MLDKLGTSLKNAISKIAGAIFIDQKTIDAICSELKRSLLEADVDIKIANELIEKIKKQASKDVKGLDKREQLIKFIHDELTKILGEEEKEIKIDKKAKPFKIMLLGLYGSGKTTTASKLAFYYAKRGFKVCMLGLDVHRPAAPEQLEQMAKKAQVTCFIDKDEKNVLAIYEKYKEKIKKFDLCIIDTAGRDVLSKDLLEEIEILNKEIKPNETFLVVPADIGKSAKEQAQGFSNACHVSGVIITRIDGTAKGGGALVSCAETNAKVIFIGVGEKLPDIETFDPSSFVSRLLGMGDLKALLEKTQTLMDEKEQEKFQSRLQEGKFTLVDFCDQIKNMQKMGPLDKVAELIPGLGNLGGLGALGKKLPDMFNVQEEKMKRWRFAIDSMTQSEKEDPDLLDSSRIARISKGANVPTNEIRELIKQYKMIKEFTTGSMAGIDPSKGGMDQKTLQKLAKKFGRRMM
jgi:signal recognition particle subunit SRP54